MKLYAGLCFLLLVKLVSSSALLGGGGLRGSGRSQGLLGGYMEHNLDLLDSSEQSTFDYAAEKGVILMNEAMKSKGINAIPIKFQELLSVRTQVIAGANYDIHMKVLIGNKVETCHILVTNRVDNRVEGGTWSMSLKDESDACAKALSTPAPVEVHVQKRSAHLLGGESDVSSESEGVQKAAHFALEHINSRSNSLFRHVLVGVSNVKRQVINGYRYRMKLTTAPSECRNNQDNTNKGVEECPVSNAGSAEECDVAVIYSLGVYRMETFTCKPTTRNPILGGDDHDYKPHGLLGGDTHDYKSHGLLEVDDRNYRDHGLLGKDLHDYLPHGRPYHMARRFNKIKPLITKSKSRITQMSIGGDDHDYINHGSDRCSQYKEEFEAFKLKHNKVYGSRRDEVKRFMVFCENMEKVKEYQKQEQGSATYGVTKFADISETEFKKHYLGLKSTSRGFNSVLQPAEIPKGSFPASWDWRNHNAVTPVKNQGACGSCWAFSTTGNVEGQWALVNKKLYSLSEQELVDCDKLDEGCNGGLPSQAYEAIMKIGGLETEKDYGYDGHDERCKFNRSEVVVTLTGAVNISKNETEMAAWLYNNGPISIGINAFAMQFYLGGIAHPWKIFCDPQSLDHGVLIVGYGSDGGEPFWIVKNSWGADWGRQGYYYVYRGDGTCGLNEMCTSAKVAKQ